MLRVAGRSVLRLLAVLWAASLLVFLLLSVLPGDPVEMILSTTSAERPTPEAVASVRHALGLDLQLHQRYALWLFSAVQGDFGRSWITGAPVSTLLAQRVGASLLLGSTVLVGGALLSFAWGTWAAAHPAGGADRLLAALSIATTAIPSFVLALLAIWFLAVGLSLGTVIGDGTLRTLALPAIVGILGLVGHWSRPFRSLVAVALGSDWVFAARSRGVTGAGLLVRHALPNALVGFLPFVGLGLARILTGTVVIETVFAWPGLGPFVVQAIRQRDIPVIQAFVILSVVVFVVSTALADTVSRLVAPETGREAGR